MSKAVHDMYADAEPDEHWFMMFSGVASFGVVAGFWWYGYHVKTYDTPWAFVASMILVLGSAVVGMIRRTYWWVRILYLLTIFLTIFLLIVGLAAA